MLQFERQAWNDGWRRVAGLDEAGRGPLAGPVVAAALVFDRALLETEQDRLFAGLTDSKQLTEIQRERYFQSLSTTPGIEIGVGICDAQEIDTINILQATYRAMAEAVYKLQPLPDHVLVDGLPVAGLPCSSTAIIRGDARSFLIAAASIVAKVTRDHLMLAWDRRYPGYGFARHKGYGTKAHVQALLEHGPVSIHRRSFRPVRDAIQIRGRIEANKASVRRGDDSACLEP